jgi:uncharacterized protein (TIGR00290 family)
MSAAQVLAEGPGDGGVPDPVALCFSGGKDSVLALQELRRDGRWHVVRLITTVTDAYDRVSMHGVRRTLLQAQAASLGLPLTEVVVPPESSNAVYEREMGRAFVALRATGVRHVAFGDIFLEDLREYRERQLAAVELEGVFPLWRADTASLARAFIEHEFRAVVVCVNPAVLDRSFAGRAFDDAFLADLPDGVDPCGERGEFHTFVSDGPLFARPIPYEAGEIVERAGFVFCDLRGAGGAADRASSSTIRESVQT